MAKPLWEGARNFRIRIGQSYEQAVIIDLTSMAELDVFQEILVDDAYDLQGIGITPTMVIDCGANIGCFASICRVLYPEAEVICWEPEPGNFARLRAQPLLHGDAASCYEAAVATKDGEVCFSGEATGGSIVRQDGSGAKSVPAMSLRNWLLQNGKAPALVKIDIEGYEAELLPTLAGAWPRPCVLVLETHMPGGEDATILSVIEREGFRWQLKRIHSLPHDPRVFKEYLAVLGGGSAPTAPVKNG